MGVLVLVLVRSTGAWRCVAVAVHVAVVCVCHWRARRAGWSWSQVSRFSIRPRDIPLVVVVVVIMNLFPFYLSGLGDRCQSFALLGLSCFAVLVVVICQLGSSCVNRALMVSFSVLFMVVSRPCESRGEILRVLIALRAKSAVVAGVHLRGHFCIGVVSSWSHSPGDTSRSIAAE